MHDPARSEAELVEAGVNVHPNGPTEHDEEQILRGLYGPADADGFYRGKGAE